MINCKPSTNRVRRLRERRKAQGMRALTIWLDQDSVQRLDRLRNGRPVAAVIAEALQTLDNVTGNTSPSNVVEDRPCRRRALYALQTAQNSR